MTSEITTIQPVQSVTATVASRYSMTAHNFEATLRATVFPKEGSKEQLAAFLLVAKEYGLNPITKEIYAFPAKGGGVQPIVSIDGWMRIINDHKQMDGMEFVDHLDEDGKLLSITCKIYRKDRSRHTEITEYMKECVRDTDTWRKWPARMLRHKAAIQAARYAFGFSGIVDEDEFERAQGHYGDTNARQDGALTPPPAPKPAEIEHKPGEVLPSSPPKLETEKAPRRKKGENRGPAKAAEAPQPEPRANGPDPNDPRFKTADEWKAEADATATAGDSEDPRVEGIETAGILADEWQEYFDMMEGEVKGARDATQEAQTHEAVTDHIQSNLERGKIDRAMHERLNDEWARRTGSKA